MGSRREKEKRAEKGLIEEEGKQDEEKTEEEGEQEGKEEKSLKDRDW